MRSPMMQNGWSGPIVTVRVGELTTVCIGLLDGLDGQAAEVARW